MGKLKNSIMWSNAIDRTSAINQSLANEYFKYHSPYTHRPLRHKYNVIGDRVEECKEVIVHTFTVGDVDDPDLYAAQPLWEWQESEAGQWVMKNAADTPTWHRMVDTIGYNYKYQIRAKLIGPALTEWLLRHGDK